MSQQKSYQKIDLPFAEALNRILVLTKYCQMSDVTEKDQKIDLDHSSTEQSIGIDRCHSKKIYQKDDLNIKEALN